MTWVIRSDCGWVRVSLFGVLIANMRSSLLEFTGI